MPFDPTERPFKSKHLAAESAQVASVPGTLHTITINRGDPHAGCVVTIYDAIGVGDAAHIIAIIVLDTAVFVIPQTLTYDSEYEHGLYADMDADATLADITISYFK